ncbi:hypothetical protein BN1708_008169 [Verticillium longisporum]|uniref:Uncharacterized protein n=1 Tax=Verticillium longisporum TaxID=100787 RepID=A0A0G4N191_VERLO|nr:hypothetical protein BN1708_008169 [Verticillium longisporum]
MQSTTTSVMDAATRPHQLGHAHTGTGTTTHDANGSYGRSQIGHAGSGHDGRLLSDNLHRYASSTAAPDAPAAAPPTRDAPSRNPAVAAHLAQPPQPHGVVDALHTLAHLSDAAAAAARRPHAPPHQLTPDDTSQDTTLTIESDNVFTPPTSQPSQPSQSDIPKSHMNGHASSQESQLLQLSQIAAAQDKMYNPEATSLSRKRTADGAVKDTNVSPVRGGHSRNTSAVSMVSTTASTIGDLSSDLKTRLSYAMVKLNHGWQSHSIDEVESMASQAASPTSSHSTLHGRYENSASPRTAMLAAARSGPHSATTSSSNPSPATYDTFWRDGTQPLSRRGHNSASPPGVAQPVLSLAPPASIQPSRSTAAHNPRRNSNPHYTPTLLSHSHSASPHTPAQQSSLQGTPLQRVGRMPLADPILFSPHQNVREQDAIETLLFMSSPGNSTNMKHGYAPATSSSQPLPGTRHALPTSQPRKSLPSHRPQPPPKRVGFEKSTSMMEMDVDADSQTGTPRTAVRRRVSGGFGHRSQLSLPAGLGDAIETLLFMSSPGNSTSMKHGYAPATSSSQPLPGTRHTLPTSQPRKSLPSHRPQPPPKRVGFEKSTSMMEMDVDADSQTGTPRTAVRRRVSGGFGHRSQLSLPAGLGSGHSRPRPKLADEDIERMLDRVAQADNDSSGDEEILLPNRREGEIVG